MAIDQSKLTPQQQAILFQLSQQAGSQPTSGGVPDSQAQPAQPVGNVDAAQLQQLFGQQAPAQPPSQMPTPGSFANDPAGAMEFIKQHMMSKATGPQLVNDKAGQLSARVPVDQPLLRLFGVKHSVQLGPNYLDTLISDAGEGQAKQAIDLLPQGLAKTPDGKPYLSKEQYQIIRQGINKPVKPEDTLDPETAKIVDQSLVTWAKQRAPEMAPLLQKMADGKGIPQFFRKQLAGYSTERQDTFGKSFYDPTSRKVISLNGSDNQYYEMGKGKKIPFTGEVGRLLPANSPQLSEKASTDFAQLDSLGNMMTALQKLHKPGYTGLFDSTAGRFKEKAGITPDEAKFRALATEIVNRKIKEMTGAQMSEQEAGRLQKSMINLLNSDSDFGPKLETMLAQIKEIRNSTTAGLASSGYTSIPPVRKFEESEYKGLVGLQPGDTENGYRFKGGDRSKKSSWEKI
jgi:hypothetical protein